MYTFRIPALLKKNTSSKINLNSSLRFLSATMSPHKDMTIPLIASIDVGTTSSRAILFDKFGKEVAKHQIEYCTSLTSQRDLHKDQNGKDYGYRNGDEPIYSSVGLLIKESENLEIEDLHKVLKKPSTLNYPKPGWVECNPINLLINVLQCLGSTLLSLNKTNARLLKEGSPTYKVVSIGITNMRETTIVWSKKTGLPIIPYGIVWNDTRNAKIINSLSKIIPKVTVQNIQERTGLPLLSTYFSSSKLRWLLDNEPKVKEEYEKGDLMFGTVDTWLLTNLTSNNNFVTDVTNASRTGFMNLDTLQYDPDLLKFWNIDPNKINLPKILPSSAQFGTFKIADTINLAKCGYFPNELTSVLHDFEKLNVPIQGCLGDQSASLVGQLAYKKGSAKCTYGTGCFLLYNIGSKKLLSRHGALTTIGYWFPDLDLDNPDNEFNKPQFALEGSIAVAGSVVQWLRDNLRLFPRAQDVGPMANTVPDSGGVVFVPAFSGLFAPYWDANARATIMGISQYTTASHIARAAVEGVCFQCRAILKAMTSDVYGDKLNPNIDLLEDNLINDVSFAYERKLFSTLCVDGGMSKSDEVMQIQADILGPCIKIRRSPVLESTALGAAIAANMAGKTKEERPLWKDFNDVKTYVFYNGNPPAPKGLPPKSDIIQTEDIPSDHHPNLKYFRSQSNDTDRRKHWKMWETAVQRSKGWLTDIDGEHTPIIENQYVDGKM